MNEKKKYSGSVAEYIEVTSSDIITKSKYEGEIDWDDDYDHPDEV